MMCRLRSRLADRKGVAIEMAMLVMVVLSSFSLLITTTALLHHSKKGKAEKNLARTVVMEQIAYDFCVAPDDFSSWKDKYPEYDIEVTVGGSGFSCELTVNPKGKETQLLFVRINRADESNPYQIVEWKENKGA